MCLTTGIRKLVAKKDITCYKVLKKRANGTYVTPYTNTKAELNKELVANYCSNKYNDSHYNTIEGGFIHALLIVKDDGDDGLFDSDCVVFESTIPSGTEFFVADNFQQICARKIFITDKVVDKADGKKSIDAIVESIMDEYQQYTNADNVAIGDFCVTDKNGSKKYIHRDEYTPEMDDDVIGVVGFFNNEDGKPVVVSRDEAVNEWCTLEWWNNRPLINDAINYNHYKKHLNGKELTENAIKSKEYKSTDYPIFKWISEYKTKGTKKGDWYVGAIGELIKMSENAIQINLSLMKLKGATLLYCWLWSSSECSSNYAYGVYTNYGIASSNDKGANCCYVRAFLCV